MCSDCRWQRLVCGRGKLKIGDKNNDFDGREQRVARRGVLERGGVVRQVTKERVGMNKEYHIKKVKEGHKKEKGGDE